MKVFVLFRLAKKDIFGNWQSIYSLPLSLIALISSFLCRLILCTQKSSAAKDAKYHFTSEWAILKEKWNKMQQQQRQQQHQSHDINWRKSKNVWFVLMHFSGTVHILPIKPLVAIDLQWITKNSSEIDACCQSPVRMARHFEPVRKYHWIAQNGTPSMTSDHENKNGLQSEFIESLLSAIVPFEWLWIPVFTVAAVIEAKSNPMRGKRKYTNALCAVVWRSKRRNRFASRLSVVLSNCIERACNKAPHTSACIRRVVQSSTIEASRLQHINLRSLHLSFVVFLLSFIIIINVA